MADPEAAKIAAVQAAFAAERKAGLARLERLEKEMGSKTFVYDAHGAPLVIARPNYAQLGEVALTRTRTRTWTFTLAQPRAAQRGEAGAVPRHPHPHPHPYPHPCAGDSIPLGHMRLKRRV